MNRAIQLLLATFCGLVFYFYGGSEVVNKTVASCFETIAEISLSDNVPVSRFAPNKQRTAPSPSFRVASWNVYELASKNDEDRLPYLAQQLKNFDIVAIQEVGTRKGKALVAKLADELNRTGAKWEAIVSSKTKSRSSQVSECYAFLWRKDKFKPLNQAKLSGLLEERIEREPLVGQFQHLQSKTTFSLVNCHLLSGRKDAEMEAQQLPRLIRRFSDANWIVLGDFNLDSENKAFDALKKEGLKPLFSDVATSLKRTIKEDGYMSQAYDNIFYAKQNVRLHARGVVDFPSEFENYERARKISDHLPVWVEFEILN